MRIRGWAVVWLMAAVALATSGCGSPGSGLDPRLQTAVAEDAALVQQTPSPTTIASITPRPTWTYTPSPARKTADAQRTMRASDLTTTPRPTKTPKPTRTPGPTRTPEPTRTPKPTRTPEPTKTPKPTKTPEPDSFRLTVLRPDRYNQTVVALNMSTEATTPIFGLPGQAAWQPIYSAAWSPDGQQVLIAYRWSSSRSDQGIMLRRVSADGSRSKELLRLPTAGFSRDLGNALWSPDGKTIAFWLLDGSNDGVYVMGAEGGEPRRLDNSVPSEWPRYWSTDGKWIVTIAGDGRLYALEVAGTRRVPLDDLGGITLYNERYFPWREVTEPSCEATVRSWWSCR